MADCGSRTGLQDLGACTGFCPQERVKRYLDLDSPIGPFPRELKRQVKKTRLRDGPFLRTQVTDTQRDAIEICMLMGSKDFPHAD